jgi:hypothetical protein
MDEVHQARTVLDIAPSGERNVAILRTSTMKINEQISPR